MRAVAKTLLVLGLVLSLGADDAFAKGKDKDKGKKKETGIELTGIESFDEVFKRVGEIDGRLASAESELRTGKRNLNTALELKKGTPLTDAITELQGRAGDKLGLAMDGTIPKLTVQSAVPSNVQSAVDAVNGLTENLTTSVADLQALSPEIQGLVKDVQKMPDRLKKEFAGADGASLLDTLFKLPKISKALVHDIEVTTGLADRTTSLVDRTADLVGVLNQEFHLVDGGHGGGKQPGKGGGGGGGGGGKKKKGGAYPK